MARFIVPTSLPHRLRRTLRRWSALSIRSKLLLAVIGLLLLSLIGSSSLFILNTRAAEGQLQDQQLARDLERGRAALLSRTTDLLQAAGLLAVDPELGRALSADAQGDAAQVLTIDRRALPVRERFRIDQLLVITAGGQVRANITSRAEYNSLSFVLRQRLRGAADGVYVLAATRPALLAAVRHRADGSMVIAAVSLSDELIRLRQSLELPAQLTLLDAQGRPLAATWNGAPPIERQRDLTLTLGQETLTLRASLTEQRVSAIIAAGRRAIALHSLITLTLLVWLSVRFSRTITQPLMRLSNMADALAAGDWSQRTNFTGADEIARLGRAFDSAAQTITTLLAQRAQEAAQRQAILQSIADGVIAVDRQEQIVLANPMALRLLKPALCAPDRWRSEPPADLGYEQLRAAVRSVLAAEQPQAEQRCVLFGCDVRFSCAPIRDERGAISGAVVVLQDISEQVAVERAKTMFIATASHELRTPLTGLKGFVDLLFLGGLDNLSAEQRQALEVVRRKTQVLISLVNDLLEIARLEQGHASVERQLVDPTETLQAVSALFAPQAQQADLHFVVELAPELPLLWIDPAHLHRILANLISNAIKYTPAGGQVRLHAYRDVQGNLRCDVADTGVGIDPADQKRIFERFFRSDNPLSVQAGGTGLGLAITRSLVELHGGQIDFHSVVGQGSCFWVVLPPAETLPALVLARKETCDVAT